MSSKHSPDEKLYTDSSGKTFSVRDLLEQFRSMGTMRASDLHIKAGVPPAYRVDGDIRRCGGPPLDVITAAAIVEAMLSDREMEILLATGTVETSFHQGKIQFRASCFKDNDGLAAAVRALDMNPPALEAIGFPNDVWRDILSLRHGLVLLTGITGSGKSTTIASLIERLSRLNHYRIITLEDPIEYLLGNHKAMVSQRQIGRDVSGFDRGLKDCLREDPDVIFVGEMRDRESAAWTLTAAETGHLVFSTLHTRDTRGTISRLLDMFPPERSREVAGQLAMGLRYVVCQKLLPRADGQGRVVAMEILNNTYATSNLIRTEKLEQLYSQLQTRTRDITDERMTTMEKSLAMLVRSGVVTPSEAELAANDRNAFLDALRASDEDEQKTK